MTRAITVRQPWAWAIARGHKFVENRSRGTSYRGTLLIHAGQAWSDRGATDERVLGAWEDQRMPGDPSYPIGTSPFEFGAVIAVASLVDSHPDARCCRPWGESEYREGDGDLRTVVHHLVLEDVVPLERPVDAKGALGLWRPSPDVVAAAVSQR